MFQKFIFIDIFFTEKWFPALMSKLTIIQEDRGINEFFEENGYSSKILVMLLGSTLVFLIILLGLFTIYPVIHLLSKFISW